jgi:hypothetical protein
MSASRTASLHSATFAPLSAFVALADTEFDPVLGGLLNDRYTAPREALAELTGAFHALMNDSFEVSVVKAGRDEVILEAVQPAAGRDTSTVTVVLEVDAASRLLDPVWVASTFECSGDDSRILASAVVRSWTDVRDLFATALPRAAYRSRLATALPLAA